MLKKIGNDLKINPIVIQILRINHKKLLLQERGQL